MQEEIKNSLNILITGRARHGKDTVCEILAKKYGYRFQSSSNVANKEVIFDQLKDKYGYKTLAECFDDRKNHRQEWFDLIVAYNTPDLTTLGRKIFETSNIYCGLRNREELVAMQEAGLVDLVVWVDAMVRVGYTSDAITITKHDSHYVVDNNRDLKSLENSVDLLVKFVNNKTWRK